MPATLLSGQKGDFKAVFLSLPGSLVTVFLFCTPVYLSMPFSNLLSLPSSLYPIASPPSTFSLSLPISLSFLFLPSFQLCFSSSLPYFCSITTCLFFHHLPPDSLSLPPLFQINPLPSLPVPTHDGLLYRPTRPGPRAQGPQELKGP